jgi:hypothetical protein
MTEITIHKHQYTNRHLLCIFAASGGRTKLSYSIAEPMHFGNYNTLRPPEKIKNIESVRENMRREIEDAGY